MVMATAEALHGALGAPFVLPAVAAGLGLRPAAVPQCLVLIDLIICRSIPYRIEAFPVRNVCF